MDAYYEETSFDSSEEYEDPHCNGCLQPIEDGSVVQFGDGIWHFECFRCAKCNKLVECYSNHLLLRDGSPICEDCSYRCHACHQTIKDEAIMTGEEAYHAECFACVQCHTRIEDLVFTQTSKGIFCTSCHEMRKQLRQKRKEERLNRQGSVMKSSSEPEATVSISPYPSQIGKDVWTHTAPVPIILTENTNVFENTEASSLSTAFKELADLNNMLSKALDSGIEDSKIDTQSINISHSPPFHPQGIGMSRSNSAIKRDDKTRETDVLKLELRNTKAQLEDVQTKFNAIKSASLKALHEFDLIKKGFTAEVAARKNAEEVILGLQHELSFHKQAKAKANEKEVIVSKEEMNYLDQTKTQIEKACDDLCEQRRHYLAELDTLSHTAATTITGSASNQVALDTLKDKIQQAYEQQLTSSKKEIETMQSNYSKLVKARNDIITEMIMLNTKNAELTSLNNDLSRRVTEREREAVAGLTGTHLVASEAALMSTHEKDSKLKPMSDSSDKIVSDLQSVGRQMAQRDSFAGVEAPKLFKFRRNKGKINKNTKGQQETLIGMPYDANVSRPMDTTVSEPIKSGTKEVPEGITYHRVGGHNFLPTKYLRPVKCEACNEKMWRVTELKCHDCGVITHSKCVYSVNLTCHRKTSTESNKSENEYSAQKVALFGNDLVKQVRAEKGRVPRLVLDCIEAVELRGMDSEGIYRKSGGAGQMRSIMHCFEQGEIPNLLDKEQWNDICAVTSVLKQYFRDLPNPLFTFDAHTVFMEAIMLSDAAEQIRHFLKGMHTLPIEHYNTLKCLILHLNNVRKRSNENLMTSKNLAVIFGPTLMRHQDETRDLLEMNHKIGAIEFILNHMDILFTGPIPEIPSNHSTPLPSARTNLPSFSSSLRHRREASCDDLMRGYPPAAVPPRENAGYI
ncbi:hypothetical protein BDF14DRAFT_1793598 [Spinellus fusiger]|nr:hypothetical protein BDF14DRAFT_1793598 [Spinellus fusiger]